MGAVPTPANAYPAARREPVVETLHGERIADPYRWLEDGFSTETNAWQAAQHELFAAHQQRWPMRSPFHHRVTQLLRTGTVGPPAWRGDYAFFVRREPDAEHAAILIRDPNGTERVLVDPTQVDPTGLTTLDAWQPSKDGLLLGYQTSHGGTEESALTVIDVGTGQVVDGPIDRCRYSPVAWLPDSSAFYYTRQLPLSEVPDDEGQYHRRVWLHRLGTEVAADTMIFGAEHDKTTFFGVRVSWDGRWLVLSASQGTAPRNDVWLADLSTTPPEAPDLRPVVVGLDAQTRVWVGRNGNLYAHTDRDAPRGRLLVGDPTQPDPEHWRELVAQDETAVLDDVAVLDGLPVPTLLCSWTRHAVAHLSVHDLDTGRRRGDVDLPGLGSLTGLAERPEGGSEVWFGYTDHLTPMTVYRHEVSGGATEVWAHSPGAVSVSDGIDARQVTYESLDGVIVRMFVLTGPGSAELPRPTILYGYGGFGISLTPAYSASVLAWLEAGGAYAIANLRGGGEEGESWHRAGMREHKQRVFDDLHAGAEWLIDTGVTRPELLSISGGSNGGLLVGAALTQRPDLYRSVVCSAPLLDMVRYEHHGLGRLWSDEYGSAEDADELRWLLTYSPYHRVHPGVEYPAVLFTVFESDSRVDPSHARKMCAALQAASTAPLGESPVLLRAETDVGHGARAISRTVSAAADTLGFAAWTTGLHPIPPVRQTG